MGLCLLVVSTVNLVRLYESEGEDEEEKETHQDVHPGGSPVLTAIGNPGGYAERYGLP